MLHPGCPDHPIKKTTFRLGRFIMENEREDAKENKIILLTIKNVVYPINTDVIYRVASLSGTVEKIVIFKKKFLQVNFNSLNTVNSPTLLLKRFSAVGVDCIARANSMILAFRKCPTASGRGL